MEMKSLKLSNEQEIPCICYGSPIINYNTKSNISIIKGQIKKILKLKFKEIKKDNSLGKVIKNMKNTDYCAIDTSSAYGASEYFIGKTINCYRQGRPGGGGVLSQTCGHPRPH